MTSTVAGASVATINDGGIVVNLQGTPDSFVVAHSNAAAGASNLMWMQNMAVGDLAGQGTTIAVASATADGAGSDAEIGIQHLSMQLAGSGALNGRTDLAATATGGGTAHTVVGDVTLNMNSSATGSSAAPVFSYIHMGLAEPGILASASDAGSTAKVEVIGDVKLIGHGDDLYVYNGGIVSHGTNGGVASTDIGGDVSFLSDGREAHSYVLVSASTDVAAGSAADVHIHGNVDLRSEGSESALSRAAVHADGEGKVDVDGHLNVTSSAPMASSLVQVTAQGDGHVAIGAIGMTIDGGTHQGWMDLFTDHSGGLTVGAVNLSATAGSEVSLNVQHVNDALTGTVDDAFLAHADSTVGVSIATANLSGAGDVHMHLNTQTFGTINQAGSLDGLDVHYQLADANFAGIGAAPMTTINGFTGAHDQVTYNGVAADATNFTDAGSFNTLGAMNAAVDTALDGTHKYVFAVYNGTEDINGNGLADDHGSGVLAWDNDGSGVTSVLMLPGVTTLTPTDIA
jgi:hypothetical protein